MVLTNNNYTKHYYIEGERVSTKIGGGFLYAPAPYATPITPLLNGSSYASIAAQLLARIRIDTEDAGYDSVAAPNNFKCMGTLGSSNNLETEKYYYHSDHLGSSSFITNKNGLASQHFQYMPYGELFVDQTPPHNDSETRYKFSGKELDPETNYSYFGARYYDSDLSVWLSVDPMSDGRPNLSPYHYCQNNPIMRVDPNGMWDDIYSIDDCGIIRKEKETNDDFDVLYDKEAYDAGKTDYDATGTKSGVSFKKGEILGTAEVADVTNSSGEVIGTGDGYKIRTKETAEKLFFFAAEHSKVEVGLIHSQNDGSIIMSNHLADKIAVTATAKMKSDNGSTITDIAHSHPYFKNKTFEVFQGPSPNDIRNSSIMLKSHNFAVDSWIYDLKSKQIMYYSTEGVFLQQSKEDRSKL